MPTLKLEKQLPTQNISLNKGNSLFSGIKKLFSGAKEAIVDFFTPETKTVTQVATAQAQTKVYEDPDKIWILTKLGNNYQSISYLEKLKTYGLSFKDIRLAIEAITKCDYFTLSDIFLIPANDFKALFQFVKLGRLSSYDATYVYGQLSDFLLDRLNCWLTTIYTNDLQLSVCTSFSHTPSEDSYNEILKYYTLISHKDLPKEVSICMRLLKLALFFLTGIILPRNRTLHLCPIWFMLLKDMLSLSHYNMLNSAGIAFALLIETAAFLAKEEMTSILSFIGSLSSTGWGALSQKTKTWILHSTDLIFDKASSEKYLCWNKTLSVLIGKTVSESQACRMISTFAFGSTVKDSLRQMLSDTIFIKRLSPIPTRSSVYEIITFFRNLKEYLKRRDAVYAKADGEIKNKSNAKERLKVSYKTYYILLKLYVAYIPNDDGKRISGCFIDPTSIGVNNDIVAKIAKRHYAPNQSNFIFNWVKMEAYKSHLKKIIKNNPTPEYIDFFGYPKNSFLLIGNKTKHYTLTK